MISQSQDGSYISILAKALAEQMCLLTIFTGKLPEHVDAPIETIASVKYDSTSFKGRLQTWHGFVKDAKLYLKEHIDDFEMVMFTSNPPINQSLVRFAQAKAKKCIYLVWDIYPDCIEASFGKKVSLITSAWRKRNAQMYGHCDAVLTIGDVMKGVMEKSYPGLNIQVLPYHTDTQFIRPIPESENSFAKEYCLLGKKVFMYSGKMGFGHGFEEILAVAEKLKNEAGIAFVFIGFGAAYEKVKEHVEQQKLHNTVVLPYQPLEVLPYSLGCATASFITIKDKNDGLFLPSKVYDAMASGSAILCISSGLNDVSKMVEEKGIGLVVKTGDVDALADAVLQIARNGEKTQQYQQNARRLAVQEYDIQAVTEKNSQMIAALLKK